VTATLAAMVVAGPGALLDWWGYVDTRRPEGTVLAALLLTLYFYILVSQ
jgi:hypothetical protein